LCQEQTADPIKDENMNAAVTKPEAVYNSERFAVDHIVGQVYNVYQPFVNERLAVSREAQAV
jgi:hypothetical protein